MEQKYVLLYIIGTRADEHESVQFQVPAGFPVPDVGDPIEIPNDTHEYVVMRRTFQYESRRGRCVAGLSVRLYVDRI